MNIHSNNPPGAQPPGGRPCPDLVPSERHAVPSRAPGLAAGGRPADAAEQPRPGGRRAPRQARRLRRHGQGGPRLALLRRDGADPAHPQAGRDDARPVRPPGRRHADPRVGPARPHRQLQPRRRLGQLGGVPPPGGPRPDHVRADDGRLLDLHRHPGHPPGHLRDLRRRRRQEVRRHPGRDHHPHRRPRRHGRRPAPRGHHERRVVICVDCDPRASTAASSTTTST